MELGAIKGRPALALPAFGLIISVLHPNPARHCGHLNRFTRHTPITLALTIWRPRPDLVNFLICPRYFH